jgi:hypothetical protein
VCKNQFLGLEQLFFCNASVFFKLLRKTMFQVPSLPTYGFWRIGSNPSMREKNNFSELEKMFFCKAQFHPVKRYKGSRQKNEPQRGIANLTYKQ